MNSTNFTDLDELIAEKRIPLLPVTIVLATIMVIGTTGNLFVVCVYGRRYQRNSAILLMLTLGLTHCLCSVLLLPFEIYNTSTPFLDRIPVLCNIWRFLETFASTYSGFIIVCMAFDRLEVSRKTVQAVPLKNTKTVCVVMLVFALAVTWPRLTLNGFGTDSNCDIAHLLDGTIYSLLFQGILCVIFGTCFIISVIVYVLIAIYCVKNRNNSIRSDNVASSALSPLRRKKFEQMLIARALQSMNTEMIKGTKFGSRCQIRPGYQTMMLCLVTFSSVIGYLPYFSVQCLRYTGRMFQAMSSKDVMVFQLCSYSYFLNNAITPLIYFGLDRRFRQQCLNSLKNTFKSRTFQTL